MMRKILLIEDNREMAGILFDYFDDDDTTLDYADNGELGLQLASTQAFDLIILDIMLPRMSGLDVCEMLRSQGNDTPILMLTALDNLEDKLSGFKYGADDYLTKPFDLQILAARINALIKRHQGTIACNQLQFGDLNIDLKTRLVYRNNQLVSLNPTSYTIIKLLCLKAPNIVTKEEIINALWQDNEANYEVLRSHIYQLRSQLDKPFDYPMVITVPKIGFRLASQPHSN